MKKFMAVAVIAIILLSLPFSFSASAASDSYYRVITEDTPFFADEDGNDFLFYLPYTYYVKVLSEGTTYTHIECYGTGGTTALDGYTLTNLLFDDDLSVSNPYVVQNVTTSMTAVLYADKELSVPSQYIFSNRTLKYYGFITDSDGMQAYYVEYNGKLGYVKESEIYPFTISLHPNELTFLPKDPVTPSPETPSSENSGEEFISLRVIIIACLVFAGLIGIFVAIKPRKKFAKTAAYYDENDYE